jgi:hypothetical protein
MTRAKTPFRAARMTRARTTTGIAVAVGDGAATPWPAGARPARSERSSGGITRRAAGVPSGEIAVE